MGKNEKYRSNAFGRFYERIRKRFTPLFHIVVAVLVIAFIFTMSSSNLMQNVESRAIAEVDSTVAMQTSAFRDHMDEQFQALRLVADMLANGRHFASEGIQPTLSSIVCTFRLCTFCMADMDGNTIDYQGNAIGSCADRAYFQEIADGSHTQVCEYLAVTKETNEPRVILSIPAYDENGEMLGVLFCSKEIAILEDSLFAHEDLFDSAAAVFICDEDGQVIAANKNGYSFFSKHDIAEVSVMNINDLGESVQPLHEDGTARRIEISGSHCFAGYTAVDDCGWGLYCFVDEADASETYRENQKRIENTISSIVLIFAACIVYILVLGEFYMRRKKREAILIQQYNDNYRHILSESHCAVVEYDADTKTMTTIQENFGDLKLGTLNGTVDAYEKYKHVHPEFDFEELESEIEIAKKNGKTCSFETILAPDPTRFYWLKTKLIPITDENGQLTRIYCVFFDVSDVHHAQETALDTYAQIPGAVHRHILTKPIHVNYYSDGLCKMLGYSHAEIDALIGSEYHYSMLICAEDRQRFIDFLDKLSKNGGGRKLRISSAMQEWRTSRSFRHDGCQTQFFRHYVWILCCNGYTQAA